MNLFCVSIWACRRVLRRGVSTLSPTVSCGPLVAEQPADAEAYAERASVQNYPLDDGWQEHRLCVAQVPEHLLHQWAVSNGYVPPGSAVTHEEHRAVREERDALAEQVRKVRGRRTTRERWLDGDEEEEAA